MPQSLRTFALVLIAVLGIMGMGGLYYSHSQHIPENIAWAVLPAFLVEIGLYIAVGTEVIRERIARTGAALPLIAAIAAVVPYCIYSIPLHRFRPEAFVAIFVLAAISAGWYFVAGKNTRADIGLLVFVAAVSLLKVFNWAYPEPYPKVAVSALGVLMWARTGYLSVLAVRRMPGVNFGLWPDRKDWVIGLKQFVFFMPLGILLGLWLNFLKVDSNPLTGRVLILAFVNFLGALWVLAPMEETFFRGVLQQALTKMTNSWIAGLIAASLLFGSVHLFFRAFPNWRFALLATVAGIFYGLAFKQARSVRAAMVTHALVVTTWRLFF